jgi:SAM-dependent methyltransferase
VPEESGKQSLQRMLAYRKVFDARFQEIDGRTPFDSVYDVDTGKPVELWELPEAAEMPIGRNARYAATPVRTARHVLANSGVVCPDVTFVDVGCGKGRVLLLAAELPFRRVVGVEASRTLCDIALRNIEAVERAPGGCDDIEVVHSDATDFEIPEDAGLFYFYEPFSTEVSEAVLDNIEASIRRHPRAVVLCFTGRGQPDGSEQGDDAPPVAAAAAQQRTHWLPRGVIPSPDGSFYDSFLFEHRP